MTPTTAYLLDLMIYCVFWLTWGVLLDQTIQAVRTEIKSKRGR